MTKYRKKPIEVNAFQLTWQRYRNRKYWPDWLVEKWEEGDLKAIRSFKGEILLQITTLEGPLTVSIDDWIIRGVTGEIYPCKPDVFEQTYDRVKGL